jgi:hypothetical protein
MIKAKIRLNKFLYRVNFLPNVLISKGKVTNPIIVRVVIKTATELIEAPSAKNDPASGNANKAGRWIIPPIIAIRINPLTHSLDQKVKL